MTPLDKSDLSSPTFSFANKFSRVIWSAAYLLFFRFTPPAFFWWRNKVLGVFGAELGATCRIYPSVKIWHPANLKVGEYSSIGPHARIYNQGSISIADRVIISQHAYLCASTHDYTIRTHPLLLAPIEVCDDVWICADAFVGPGVTVGVGSVIGARAVLTKNSYAWSVYAGNPAQMVKERVMK